MRTPAHETDPPAPRAAPEPEDAAARAEAAPPAASPAGRVLRLQRAIGNQATQRLLRAGPTQPPRRLQTRLTVGEPGDAYEREAERVAEQVMRAPAGPVHDGGEERIQPLSEGGGADAGSPAPPIVDEVLRGPGQPLDPGARAFMETRFGQDFGGVRVHTGARAAESARAVSAQAYTVGSDVVFGAGRYAPEAAEGRKLIAHELTHVVQQTGGSARRSLQRKGPKKKPEAKGGKDGVTFWYSVKLTGPLDSDRLLLALIRQYKKLKDDAEAERVRVSGGWGWTGTPQAATQADADKGYILIQITDRSLKPQDAAEKKANADYFAGLGAGAQAEINQEADARFWANTEYREGEKLGTSADDRKMAKYWLELRGDLLRQRRAIDDLPPHIRKFIFTDDAPRHVLPKDYATVLRLAAKLAALPPEALADYKSKVTAETTDWRVFEESVDRYIQEHAERQRAHQARETTKTRIYGLDELYTKYRAYLARLFGAAAHPGAELIRTKVMGDPSVADLEAELTAGLKRHGFASIVDFAAALDAYEAAFRAETVAIAMDMLQRYEHVLYEEEKKYRTPAAAAALHQSVAGSGAKADYAEAEGARGLANAIRPDPDLHRYLPGEVEMKRGLERKADAAHAGAERKVKDAAKAAGGHPLVEAHNFDRAALAGAAGPAEVQSQITEYIAARRRDVATTRADLIADPDRVYKLDELLKFSFQAQGVDPASIYGRVINDHIADNRIAEILWKVGVAIFAIALGVISFGTGTVATVAAVGAFGLSAYQAIEEFKEYERGQAAYDVGFSSDDPSFAWVVVAAVGALGDAAAAAAALKALAPAAKAFNEAGDLAKLGGELEALEKLGQIDAKLRANVAKAAEAELELRKSVKSLVSPGQVLYSVLIPGIIEAGKLVVIVYRLARRGAIAFENLILELKAAKLLSKLEDLSPEQLVHLKGLFEEAKAAAGALSDHGRALGMTDDQIEAFAKLWSEAPTGTHTLDSMKDQMAAWAAVKESGVPWGFADADALANFKAVAQKGLKKAGHADAEGILQGSAVTGISYSKKLPFRAESDLDMAIASPSLFKQAEKKASELKLEIKRNPLRIGPLDEDQIRKLGLGSLNSALAKAADGRTVNFMLFKNREAALQWSAASVPLK